MPVGPRGGEYLMLARIEENAAPLLLAMGLGGLVAFVFSLQSGPWLGIGILAIAVTGLALFNRRATLYLIAPAIALTPELPFLGVPLRLEDLLMLPLAVGWLAHQCLFRDHRRTPLDRLLLAYLIVGLLATLWGGYLGSVHFGGLSKDTAAPFHMLKRLELLLLFFIISDTLTEARDVQRLTYVMIASMVALSAFALSQYFLNPTVVTEGGAAEHIAVGPADPGHEAGFGSMISIALALSLLPAATRSAKLLLIAVVLFSVIALPPTLGRNYMATTAIVMLYIGLFRMRWILLFIPLAWLAALHLYPPEIVKHALTLQHVFAPDTSGAATSGASVISRSAGPFFFGLLGLGYSPILGFGLASISLGALDSEYATQLYYTGLVGLAIFLLLGARLFRLTREAIQAARDPMQKAMANGFQLVWIAYAVHSVFSPGISASRVGAEFFFMSGLLVVLHRCTTQTTVGARADGGRGEWSTRVPNGGDVPAYATGQVAGAWR
jgi:hypothetical protein